MDQRKTGKFIAAQRKAAGLTQLQLAERLGITDRAVSKWETGRALPDASVMLALCGELGISVNELLSGERVTVENYDKELENNLLEMVKEKEERDRLLLQLESIAVVLGILPLLPVTVLANRLNIAEWQKGLLAIASIVPFLIITPFLIRIEQKAGYYECAECGHRYVPTFKAVNLAPHVGRTRKMFCPECSKKSWQKKVLSKQ